jgi:hypothetical protein
MAPEKVLRRLVDVGAYSSSIPGNSARKSLDVSKDQLGNPKRKV